MHIDAMKTTAHVHDENAAEHVTNVVRADIRPRNERKTDGWIEYSTIAKLLHYKWNSQNCLWKTFDFLFLFLVESMRQ